ncbi:MAG: MBL fold metallo-hydrolase [Bradymonadaceae bacterium]|nr:MBL fold metallo-hydrolase [Lujinxingiaceae bacterium]
MSQALPLRVSPLVEAHFALDGGAMFGIIPQPLWERTNPGDEQNRIDLACRCLLVEYADKRVLIDVGIGTKWSPKEVGIYNIRAQDDALKRALALHSLSPDDIDEVVLTHLHFDHAGGVSYLDESGHTRASFPGARHWLQKRNWAWAQSPSTRDGGSYRPADFAFFDHADAPKLELVDGLAEILPGIEVMPCHGHTFGMQIAKITTAQHTYVFLADLIPTTSHLRDPYVMGYDLQPLVTVEEKREILYHAARHDWILVFGHDPVRAFARVEMDKRGQPTAIPHA